MTETNESELRNAVEHLHDCKAVLKEAKDVKDIFQEQTAWEGIVHIFDIEGHPDATRCYAWSSPIEGSEKRKFYAVLHIPPVDSPEKAVRAANVADYRTTR